MSITRRRSTAAVDGDTTRTTISTRARVWRRLGRGALVVAAGSTALALAGPMALRPFTDVAGAAGQVTVAFVLDFGPGSTPVTGCVSVPDTSNRYAALAAFATSQGMAPPTYAPSGLLCSINAIPSSGCGQSVAGGYVYWSYFTGGTSSWIYASTGAFGTVTPGDVEGWRFQNPGTGRPNDPAPRTAPNFNSICTSGPGSSTTTSAPATNGGGSGAGTSASASAGASAGAGAGKLRIDPSRPTGAATPPGPSAVPATKPAGGSPSSTGASTTTTTTTTTRPSASASSVPDVSVPADPVVNVTNTRHASAASGPGPAPLIVGGLLVAALAIAAYVRWRKRPRTS